MLDHAGRHSHPDRVNHHDHQARRAAGPAGRRLEARRAPRAGAEKRTARRGQGTKKRTAGPRAGAALIESYAMDVLLPRLAKRMLLGVILLCPGVSPNASSQTSYWPAGHWRTAQPESQGVDSRLLTAAIDQVMEQRLGVHSLLVIRHGYAVLHADFYPYNSDTPHDLASVTKSITSALAGIAVGRGLLRMDQPLLSFFPDERPAKPDPRARRITVGDVVHMESGLDCGYLPGEQELERMKPSPDFVRFALSLPHALRPRDARVLLQPRIPSAGFSGGRGCPSTGTRICPPELVRTAGHTHRDLGG